MKNRPKMLVILGIIFVFAIVGTSLMVNSQIQNNNSQNKQQDDKGAKIRQKIEQNGDPIAEFNAPEPVDPKERRFRQNRGRKYNINSPNVKPGDISRFFLNDNVSSITIIGPWTTRRKEIALPVGQSSHIVIGSLKNAKSFISEDRTSIYSEFIFDVENVLKQNGNPPLNQNNQLTLNRSGGKVRLPSGKLLSIVIDGKPLPKNGRYLMFLSYDVEAESFKIITGYEFQGGRVKPLDGVSVSDSIIEQYQNYQRFNEANEVEFVEFVKSTISQNQGGFSQ
jgi:hypothetical protein